METTLPALLAARASEDHPQAGYRFLDASERESWFGLDAIFARARRAAGALRALGLRHGDVVALILPTHVTFFDAWFGCQLLGVIPVALYPPVRLGRLDEYVERTAAMLRVSGAALLISEPRIRRLLGQVIERAPLRLGLLDAAALQDGAPCDPVAVGPDDTQMIQFSSGTTVAPKAVELTHRQTLANASVILDVILTANPKGAPAGQDEPGGVSWLPLYHDMGLIGCVFPAILGVGPLTLIPPEAFLARPALWLRAISRYRGTISPAPNFAFALCTERIRDEELVGVDLSSWSLALNGAEPVSPATCAAFVDRFGRYGLRPGSLMPVYGLSEMALAVTFSRSGGGVRSRRVDPEALAAGRVVDADAGPGRPLVSCGEPLPGYAVEIRGADGVAAPDGHIGEVWASGPSRMKGYRGRDDQPFVGPWLATGDLGARLDGELYITGRAKDLIVIRGRNHAPQDVEAAVDAVAGVRVGCAAAVADLDGDGERLLVFVEVRERAPGQAEACADAIRGRLGVSPDLVVLLEPGTLPRTSSGKIRRGEALAQWRRGALAPPESVTPWMLAGAFAKSAMGFLRARWRAT